MWNTKMSDEKLKQDRSERTFYTEGQTKVSQN